jgi:hypothetical protein
MLMMKRMVAVVAIAVGMPAAVRAQTPTGDERFVVKARPVPLVLDIDDAVRRVVRRDVRELVSASVQTPAGHHVRHPVLIGAAIGAGAGFVLNASACRTGESVCTSAGNLMMAGIGAGVGSVIGWLVAGR